MTQDTSRERPRPDLGEASSALVRVYATEAEASRSGARSFADRALEAVAERGRFTVALSGGDTPRLMYEMLATPELARSIPWDRVHVFWGDDRGVAPDHPRSNFRMAREALLDHVDIPAANVHRIQGELPATEAARLYESELRSVFGGGPALPRFDLIHLGIGGDGHTASLFPGEPSLHESSRWVLDAIDRSHHDEPRVTFTFPVINAARAVEVLVLEPAKADVVHRVLSERGEVDVLPARGIAPTGEHVWLLSTGAARRLASAGQR